MKILKRKYLDELISVTGTPDIKVITGIRRSGKSKLLELFKEYLEKDKTNNIIHINFNVKDFDKYKNADSLYKYIDSQKKDKKNATIKLQVINEYLSVALYKNIDNTQKIKNNFVRDKEDIGAYNNSFINTFSYGPSYFYYESEHLTDKEKQKIKELL